MRVADLMPLAPEACAKLLGVSRETLSRLEIYVALLRSWNVRINLVGADSLEDVWRRHILDSGQLFRHLPAGATSLIDLGSGAGLPGLVLAILGAPGVHLVESDQRKAAFLREAARVTATAVKIHATRSDAVPAFPASVITARALAPLPKLLEMALPFVGPGTVCLFLKGGDLGDELTAAQTKWIMKPQVMVSDSDPTGHILRLEELQHAPRPSTGSLRP